MPTLDLSKMVLLTQREKEKFKEFGTNLFNKALSGLVPPASQSDYELMKRDPWAYINYQAKQPPTREEIGGIIEKTTEAMPLAFHGSPHTFEKFSVEKVGTGQGAQSYGHGLYFAENPKVAERYADELKRFNLPGLTATENEAIDSLTKRYVSGSAAKVHETINALEGDAARKPMREALSKYVKAGAREGAEQSTMYQVDIPDEHVSKMLDWDKPLSEQPEILAKINARIKELLPDISEKSQQRGFYGNMKGGDFYNYLSDILKPPPSQVSQRTSLASSTLNQLGIPGIKYLDQGSRAAGKGTRNFVVFDESILKETKRMK